MLEKKELQQLKAYIEKRSLRFAEPVILLEILDHFACKVEEICEANPDISLHDAMNQAHASFGVRGFAPLADQAEYSLFKKYRRIALQEMRSVVMSPVILYLALSGLLCYQIQKVVSPLLPQSDWFLILDLPLLCYVICLGWLRYRRSQNLKKHQLELAMSFRCSPIGLAFNNAVIFIAFICLAGTADKWSGITLYILPLMVAATLFSGIVESRLQRKALQDIAGTEKILSGIA